MVDSIAATRFARAAACTARALGVADALVDPLSIDEILARTAVPARRLRPLLELLVGAGYLARDASGRLARGAEPWPATAPGATLIAEVIRRDRAYDASHDGWALQLEARPLAPGALLSVGAAASLAEHVLSWLPAGGVFLDAGGGLGDVTRAVLAAAPDARAVLVDLPAHAALARRALASLGDRVEIVDGDLRTAALPVFDVAVLANVLHLHAPAAAAEIVAAVRRASPDGTIIVKDIVHDITGDGRLRALAFAVATVVFDDRGEVHAATDLVRWLDGPCELENPFAAAPECAVVISRPSR